MKPSSSTLAFRLNALKDEIARACSGCGRDPSQIKLVAVSKGQSFQAIVEAYDLGVRDFGESYAQEFLAKLSLAKQMKLVDLRWHFIGALQSNKVKTIAQAHVVQSIDNLRHAELLNQASNSKLEVFLQVNLSPSPRRRGFEPKDLRKAIGACADLSNLHLQGLMTIAPLMPEYKASHWFRLMREIRGDLGVANLQLSMGMSSDFTEAIAYGADIIRIGTGLFGSRIAH